MYFGSVKFFKHLIVVMILLLILGLAISTICLANINKNYRYQIADMRSGTVLAQSNVKDANQQNSISIEYQELYPEMYSKLAKATKVQKNTVYLSFDDGPSERTNEILDILKEKNIKATFFVIGKEGEKEKDTMRRIVSEGHTIAIHTYSHVYGSIYESVESYLADFNQIYHLIYETTGVKADVFRFPGGSINKYNALIQEEITAEMTRRGFTYYDWNASSGDATSEPTAYSVYNNSIQSAADKSRVILLMHDSANKSYTVAALPDTIDYFKAKGFQFHRITNDVSPVAFNYNDY